MNSIGNVDRAGCPWYLTSSRLCLDLHEYHQHVKKNLDRNLLENNRDDLERRHLTNELNSLNDSRVSLRQKLNLIQEHYKQLELNVDREVRRRKDVHENYDELSKHLRLSIREYVSEDYSAIQRLTEIPFRRTS